MRRWCATSVDQQEGLNAWVEDKLNKADNASQSGPLQPLVDVVPKNIFRALSDMAMLQIIFFAVFFGIVLVQVEEPKRGALLKAVDGLNDVFVGMVWMVMKAMPVFVFALMAGQIVKAAGTDPEKFQELLSFLLQVRPGGGGGVGAHDFLGVSPVGQCGHPRHDAAPVFGRHA